MVNAQARLSVELARRGREGTIGSIGRDRRFPTGGKPRWPSFFQPCTTTSHCVNDESLVRCQLTCKYPSRKSHINVVAQQIRYQHCSNLLDRFTLCFLTAEFPCFMSRGIRIRSTSRKFSALGDVQGQASQANMHMPAPACWRRLSWPAFSSKPHSSTLSQPGHPCRYCRPDLGVLRQRGQTEPVAHLHEHSPESTANRHVREEAERTTIVGQRGLSFLRS